MSFFVSFLYQLVDNLFVWSEILDNKIGMTLFLWGSYWIFENVYVGMEMSHLKFLDKGRQCVLHDDKFVGIDFEHVLNEAWHWEIDLIVDVKLIHSFPEFVVVGLGKVGVKYIDPNSKRFISLRRLTTHEEKTINKVW